MYLYYHMVLLHLLDAQHRFFQNWKLSAANCVQVNVRLQATVPMQCARAIKVQMFFLIMNIARHIILRHNLINLQCVQAAYSFCCYAMYISIYVHIRSIWSGLLFDRRFIS